MADGGREGKEDSRFLAAVTVNGAAGVTNLIQFLQMSGDLCLSVPV